MRTFLPALLLALLPLAASAQGITVQWPNGGAPCTAGTTLQACIDGVPDGSTIVLNLPINTPIDEFIEIEDRVLTLRGYPGTRPEMAPFQSVYAIGGSVRVENLTFRGGQLVGVSTNLTAHRVRVFDANYGAIEFRDGQSLATGPMHLRVTESELVGRDGEVDEQRLIAVQRSSPGTLTADIAFNTLRPSSGQGHAISLYCMADCSYSVRHNSIRGERYNGGIGANSSGPATVRLDVIGNLVEGQWGNTGGGTTIGARLDEAASTINIVNNTILRSRRGIALSTHAQGGGTMQGTVANNLIAELETYSVCVPDTIALRHNLTWDNGGDDGPLPNIGARAAATAKGGSILVCQPPGVGNVHADPRLDGARLRADSPARNAGDNGMLQDEAAAGRLVDLDGMRRIVGDAVDIGAYEFDTRLRTVRVPRLSSTIGLLPFPRTDDAAHPVPVLSPLIVHPTLPVAPPLRVLISPDAGSGQWSLETPGTLFPDGAAFALFTPQPWRGSAQVAVNAHNSRFNNTALEVDHAQVMEGDPMFFLRTGSGTATNHMVCRVDGIFSRHYVLRHADDATMPYGSSFHVYTQNASPNAFRHETTFYNGGGTYSVLDHPLLNGNACARPMVAPADCDNPHPIAMRYAGARWEIFNLDNATLNYGSSFDVLVDPRQIEAECGPRVFADGFE